MQSRRLKFGIPVILFALLSATMHSQDQESWPSGDLGQIQPAAFQPSPSASNKKKKPLTEKDLNSGASQIIRRVTGTSTLDIHVLYETSGAKDFKEFSQALMVARNLRLDPQLVLRALYEQDLESILEDFAIPRKEAKSALKIAKKQLEEADKEWKRRRSLPTGNALE
ncbi:hypothetical protein MYX82_02465 [Acidobacteria bacterium AH-259-D05]|nr:hypothetical protein [Acidobacteria bacterium AH-259-D05]